MGRERPVSPDVAGLFGKSAEGDQKPAAGFDISVPALALLGADEDRGRHDQ